MPIQWLIWHALILVILQEKSSTPLILISTTKVDFSLVGEFWKFLIRSKRFTRNFDEEACLIFLKMWIGFSLNPVSVFVLFSKLSNLFSISYPYLLFSRLSYGQKQWIPTTTHNLKPLRTYGICVEFSQMHIIESK